VARANQPDPSPEIHGAKDLNRGLHRLTIKHLMFWLLGVSIALVVAQQFERNNHAAEAVVLKYRGLPEREFEPLGIIGAVIAAGFGTGISLAILAVLGGPGFWHDPARVGITVFGVIGLLRIVVELSVTSYVASSGQPFIWQADFVGFMEFAVHLLGFVLACAVTPWVRPRWNWAIAWWCLIVFALIGLVIHSFHFPVVKRQLPWLSELLFWRWELTRMMQSSLAITGLVIAVTIDLWKRNINWLVIVASVGMIVGLVAEHLEDFLGLFRE